MVAVTRPRSVCIGHKPLGEGNGSTASMAQLGATEMVTGARSRGDQRLLETRTNTESRNKKNGQLDPPELSKRPDLRGRLLPSRPAPRLGPVSNNNRTEWTAPSVRWQSGKGRDLAGFHL